MGMVGNYLRVSQSELEEFLNDSSKLEDRVYSESGMAVSNLIDVDKAWDGIFYLLTGKTIHTVAEAAEPFVWISYAPNEIDSEQDMGYGPACYTTVAQTKQLNDSIQKITDEELKNKYDGKQMIQLGIYPQIWANEESRDYLFQYFNELKAFYQKKQLKIIRL